MAVIAGILINQAGKPAGVVSTSREDLALSIPVVLSNNNNTGIITWTWTLVSAPPGSAAALSATNTASVYFTPDVIGSYLVRLIVTGISNTSTDERIGAVITDNLGFRIPVVKETTQYDNVNGWEGAMYDAFTNIDKSVPFTSVKLYGAVGDGIVDDTAAIQAAVNALQNPGLPDGAIRTLYFPNGLYKITAPIVLSSVPIKLEGEDQSYTYIRAFAAMEAIFKFADVLQNRPFIFKKLRIDCRNFAQYGIVSNKISNSLFEKIMVEGSTVAGISVGYGWNNDFVDIQVSNNYGHGIMCLGNSNNAVNFDRCKVGHNNGAGVIIGAGGSQNFTGCTLEANKKGGIYFYGGSYGVTVIGCYFEANSADGYDFASPVVKNVKSDIIFNGTAATALGTIGLNYPCFGIDISGCFFDSACPDGQIYILTMLGMEVRANTVYGSPTAPLIGAFSPYCGGATPLRVTSNSGTSVLFDMDGNNVQYSLNLQLHDWSFDTVKPRNYISDDVLANVRLINRGYPIVLSRSATAHNGSEVWEFAVGDDGHASDIWGQTINLNYFPELQNAWVQFSCLTKIDVPYSNLELYVSTIGSNVSYTVAGTDWFMSTAIFKMPASGPVSLGFARFGAAGKVYISRPVLAPLGTPYKDYYRQDGYEITRHVHNTHPISGTWKLGDIVWNNAPTNDGYVGWICTSSGTSGTWKTFGHIS